MYGVAAMVCYALVDTEKEGRARERGKAALEELYAAPRQRHPGMHIEIRTVPPAIPDEIDFCRWYEETLAREGLVGRERFDFGRRRRWPMVIDEADADISTLWKLNSPISAATRCPTDCGAS
jgi:hypothetical protein